MRFSALGDVAMLSPVVKEVAEEHKDWNITVMSQPFCAPLFDDIASNVKFIGKDVKKAYKGVSGLYRLFCELDAEKYDYVVDCHDVLRTKMLRFFFRMHGYKVARIDKHRELRKVITAPAEKKVLKQLPTSFDNYRTAIAKITEGAKVDGGGKTADGAKIAAKMRTADGTLAKGTSAAVKRVGIAPFAAHQGKIYPLDRMEKIIELLGPDREVILFGGGGKEKEIMQGWADRFPHVRLASETHKGLREELKLMRLLDVMVSMDSANMHLASLVGTRVVSVWGATHPFAGFLGWGQRQEDCVQVDLPCRPCSIYGNKPCLRGDMACMNMIAPDMVVKAILS